MRKFTLTLLFISAAMLTAVSCSKDEEPQTVTVTFDMVQIDDSGYINNGTYTENGITFANSYDATYGSWSGFALSNCTDMQTTGYANQYSVYATSGAANSRNFAVAYYEAYTNTPAKFSFEAGKEFTINSLAVNNSTYVYLDILNGSAYSKKFTTGDWYKIIFTGYTSAGTEAGKVEFYAADYRGTTPYLCDKWTTVDLSSLGKVNRIEVSMDSSDTGEYGINTPCYICIDNVTYQL